MKYLALLFVLIASCALKKMSFECNYSKDYYGMMIKGEIAYELKEYEKAYSFYKQAFSKCSPRNTRIFYEIDKMARITALLGKEEECSEFLLKQLNEGFTINKYTNDTLFKKVLSTEKGIQLVQISDSLSNVFKKNIDPEMIQLLNEMGICDQKYRKDSKTYKENKIEQNRLDSINVQRMIYIFEKYGYPQDKYLINSNNLSSHFLTVEGVLLHTKDSLRIHYFLPKIKTFVENGTCDPLIYAQMYDQFYLYNGAPQIYGTYKKRDRSLSDHIPIDELNRNRKEIGLPTLEEEEKIHQLKIKNYPNSYGKIFSK